jgi:hypothetical protein
MEMEIDPSAPWKRPREGDDEKQPPPKAIHLTPSLFERVPHDCLEGAFSFLDITDLSNAGQVCKTWHSMMPNALESLYKHCEESPFMGRIIREEKASGSHPNSIAEALSNIRKRALGYVNTNRFLIGIDPLQTDLNLAPLKRNGEGILEHRHEQLQQFLDLVGIHFLHLADSPPSDSEEQDEADYAILRPIIDDTSYEGLLKWIETRAAKELLLRGRILDSVITQVRIMDAVQSDDYQPYSCTCVPEALQFWDRADRSHKIAILAVTLRSRDIDTLQKIIQKDPNLINSRLYNIIKEAAFTAVNYYTEEDKSYKSDSHEYTPSYFSEVVALLEKNGISTQSTIMHFLMRISSDPMTRRRNELVHIIFPYIPHIQPSPPRAGQALPPPTPLRE